MSVNARSMNSNKKEENFKDIEKVLKKFQSWRKEKKSTDRIPEKLWNLALKLTKNHPVACVAAKLALDYNYLKSLKDKHKKPSSKEVKKSPFVQVKVSETPQSLSLIQENNDCVLELLSPNGNQMKIYRPALESIDFIDILENFLNSK